MLISLLQESFRQFHRCRQLALSAVLLLVALLLLSTGAFAQSAFEESKGGVDRTALPIFGGQIDDVAIASNGNLYVGLNSPNGIFCSTDGAASWQGPPAGSDFGNVKAVELGETADTVYILAGIELYKSEDACATWTEISTDSNDFSFGLAFGHGRILAGTGVGTVRFSTDGGDSFNTGTLTGATQVLSIAASPTSNTFFAVATTGGNQTLFQSTDGGATWTSTGKTGTFGRVAVNPEDANFVVLSGLNLVEISTNGGMSFNDVTPIGLALTGITFIDVPSQPDRLFVGNLYTVDQGANWDAFNSEVTSTDSELTQLIVQHPTEAATYYMVSNRGLAKSTDTLANWNDMVEGMLGISINDIAQAVDKNIIYLAGTAGVAKSENYLSESPTWTFPLDPTGTGETMNAVHLPDPANGDLVIAGGGPFSSVYRSEDGGESWTPINLSAFLGMSGAVNAFAEAADGKIYAGWSVRGAATGGVIESTDDGQGWNDSAIPNSPPVNAVLTVDNTLFVGVGIDSDTTATERGIYRLQGTTWEQLGDEVAGQQINDLASNGAFLFAAAGDVTQGGLFRSNDNGETWEDLSEFFEDARCMQSLAVDPADTAIIFAASGCPSGPARIYRSTDGGATWSLFYEALRDEVPQDMFVDELIAGLNTGAFEFSGGEDRPSSPVYLGWNGFLQMLNILELVNTGDTSVNVTVTLFDSAGVQQSQVVVPVAAKSQFDVIVNALGGFAADALGIIKVEFPNSSVDGRIFFYRTVDQFVSYEFAFGVPFTAPLVGTSFVSFNTFNPSLNPFSVNDVVLNWLSVINLDQSSAKSFTINRYSLAGELLNTTNISVPAFGRIDIDGGHGEGSSVVGYNEIIPTDPSAPYLAQLVRYGQRPDFSYSFGFPLLATDGNDELFVPISRGAGAQNWIEVQNVTAGQVNVMMRFLDNAGNNLGTMTLNLPARSGQHLEASALLPDGQSGAVIIESSDDAVIAQSMFYFRDEVGDIEAMYGSQADDSRGGTRWGTYNLFLGMFNWLRIFNPGDTAVSVALDVFPPGGGTPNQRMIELPARSGIDLGLHETANYGTQQDTYGVFSVSGSGVLTELLRLRGDIDFAAPTAVRR